MVELVVIIFAVTIWNPTSKVNISSYTVAKWSFYRISLRIFVQGGDKKVNAEIRGSEEYNSIL